MPAVRTAEDGHETAYQTGHSMRGRPTAYRDGLSRGLAQLSLPPARYYARREAVPMGPSARHERDARRTEQRSSAQASPSLPAYRAGRYDSGGEAC